jgi:lipoic acid synthetase
MTSCQTSPPSARRRLPAWLRLPLPTSPTFARTRLLLDELRLHTVCESAKCPNHWECWSKGTATFMIAGERCTRACGFCAVTTARPFPLEADEPLRVAEAVRRMGLRHVVITAVARDDLADGGSTHFCRTIGAVGTACPGVVIEVLTPDFNGDTAAIRAVVTARPHIFNHNLETVRRLTPRVRSRASYDRSLAVLAKARAEAAHAPSLKAIPGEPEQATPGPIAPLYTKSGMMLGLGEREDEVVESMADLRRVGCDILTLGQYLQPTRGHLPVIEFIPPEQFSRLQQVAIEMGFIHVASGPLVRSSYHADEFLVPECGSAA